MLLSRIRCAKCLAIAFLFAFLPYGSRGATIDSGPVSSGRIAPVVASAIWVALSDLMTADTCGAIAPGGDLRSSGLGVSYQMKTSIIEVHFLKMDGIEFGGGASYFIRLNDMKIINTKCSR